MKNLLPFVVVSVAPVLVPTENPENVMVPAVPLFVVLSTQDPSAAGAVMVKAPPFVMDCSGRAPQSTVILPVDCPSVVTVAPPETTCEARSSAASVWLELGRV